MDKHEVKFILPCGVKVECSELYGEQQEILTKEGVNDANRINEFLVSIIGCVGSVRGNELTTQFVENMRSEDRRQIMAMVRQATFDYEQQFEFTYQYVDANGNNKDEKLTVNLNDMESEYTGDHITELSKRFGKDPETISFLRELNKTGTFRTTPAKNRATEYKDLQKYYEFTLPKSGYICRMEHLTGRGERLAAQTPKKHRNVNTLLRMRFPKYKKTQDEKNWLSFDFKKVHAKDLKFMRQQIELNEGSVEMEIRFENPDETKRRAEPMVQLDLVGQTAFFFPSEALK